MVSRSRRASTPTVRIQWFTAKVVSKIDLTMKTRMFLAVQYLEGQIVRNISRPVTKFRGPRGGLVVTNRSRPGEFPKADTTNLMKSIFSDVRVMAGKFVDGFVGTPVDYGVILELLMDRSFMVRTLRESQGPLLAILAGPIK